MKNVLSLISSPIFHSMISLFLLSYLYFLSLFPFHLISFFVPPPVFPSLLLSSLPKKRQNKAPKNQKWWWYNAPHPALSTTAHPFVKSFYFGRSTKMQNIRHIRPYIWPYKIIPGPICQFHRQSCFCTRAIYCNTFLMQKGIQISVTMNWTFQVQLWCFLIYKEVVTSVTLHFTFRGESMAR